MRVRWRGHADESDDTWEPLEFLLEDVPVLVRKFVLQQDEPALTRAYNARVDQDDAIPGAAAAMASI